MPKNKGVLTITSRDKLSILGCPKCGKKVFSIFRSEEDPNVFIIRCILHPDGKDIYYSLEALKK